MIEITDAASKRIHSAMDQEGIKEGGLRVGVKAGGCSGLSYVFKWEQAPASDDEVFESDSGARIYVDPKSLKYLDGTVLDCDPNMLGQSLILRNPNAKAECGCGLSFGV
ncbi:MAG: iron-sulfur cluster assembly accessory protein [Acidobacteriota bacterium]|nr:iron-sulfur cluster assembly accessory protein [Acidobacteriota bacterium]